MNLALEATALTCVLGGNTVVAEVGLEARPGEVLALIGPNGAGKTTLLRAMARLLRPGAGAVLLEGGDIWHMPASTVARRLALAPQGGGGDVLLTVEQLVALGRAPHRGWLLPLGTDDRAAVERALTQVGLAHLRQRPVAELSGGEQRRAILARALAQEPRVLLLDEPTAALDLKYQTAMLELAWQLAHDDGITVIVTLHDLNQAALIADRVALLAAGRLLATGSPSEIFTAERISQAYGVPVVIGRHPIYATPLVTPILTRRTS